MAGTVPTPLDDFNPKQAYESLSANIEQPDKFAQLFCKAAETQKSIDSALEKVVINLLQKDHPTIKGIKQLQREVNKEDWHSFIRKIGWTGWALIWMLFEALYSLLPKLCQKNS